MTIINFDDIIGKKFDTITNNIFCLSHTKNALIIGKTNILMNLIAQNSIYDKINKEYVNFIIFDDLIFSNKKYLNFIVEVEN